MNTIETLFVPYELAVKLKALGFEEPCFATWSGETLDMSLQIPSDDYFTKAPTFSQAFRWFRENYNLNYWVKEESQVRFSWRIYKGDGYATWDCHPLLSNTYEEAELACLVKIIEIVEQQNQK